MARAGMIIMVTSMMVMNICSGLGSGMGTGVIMSKSEVSEMERAQLGNPSMSRSADHTGF
jgi:hypothetical protein